MGAIAEAWRHGTVVRSWLLDLAASELREDAVMEGVAPVVADSGEGRWTVREGLDLGVPLPVIGAALNVRLASQGRGDYAARFLARLRNAFGGHVGSRRPSEALVLGRSANGAGDKNFGPVRAGLTP